MVLKLKSRTVLRPLIFTRPLASHGVSECLSNVLSRSNLFLEISLTLSPVHVDRGRPEKLLSRTLTDRQLVETEHSAVLSAKLYFTDNSYIVIYSCDSCDQHSISVGPQNQCFGRLLQAHCEHIATYW